MLTILSVYIFKQPRLISAQAFSIFFSTHHNDCYYWFVTIFLPKKNFQKCLFVLVSEMAFFFITENTYMFRSKTLDISQK